MNDEREELTELKHYNCKCPVCGNTDFVRIKKPAISCVNWDIESEMEIIGCTKCYYLMHFCKSAVLAVQDIEEDREKIQKEIDGCKQQMILLEQEEKALVDSLERLENEARQFKDVPSYLSEEMNKINNKLECDIRWRIKLFKQEIERLERGDESYEYWPEYNHYNLQNSYFFKEFWNMFDLVKALKEKVAELEKNHQ